MSKIEYRQVDLAANGTADLMTQDATTGFASGMRIAPVDSIYQLRILATSTAVQMLVNAGPENVIGTSPVANGGTIGVFPAQTDSEPLQFEAAQGDEIAIQLRNTAGLTPSVMAVLERQDM